MDVHGLPRVECPHYPRFVDGVISWFSVSRERVFCFGEKTFVLICEKVATLIDKVKIKLFEVYRFAMN